jgi:hypothetical protein
MTFRTPMRLSSEALHRIRVAAGGWPADLDIFDLGRQLSQALSGPDFSLHLRDIKTQKALLKKIHKAASKLADLLRIRREEWTA